jgi:hypothetical protein
MSHISSIFTLKPIVDLFHNDALQYVIEIDRLKDQIAELKKENMQLREIIVTPIKIEKVEIGESTNVIAKEEKPHVISKNIVIDDTVYSKEAETFVEPVNTVVENTEKVVVVNTEKSRKEYQQEYQRQYRKQKKEQQNK